MTGQDMIDELRDHEFDDLTDERLLALLNDQYQDVCSRFQWPFLEKTATVTTNSSGVISFSGVTDLNKVKSLYNPSDAARWDLLADSENFFIDGNNSYTLVPGYENLTLTLHYYAIPADLIVSTAPIFPAKHHRVVVLGAASRAYYMTDDIELGTVFERQYEERIIHMAADLLRRGVGPAKVVDIGP